MRTTILSLVLVAACGGKKAKEEEQAVARAALVVPKVDVATALAKDPPKLPWLMLIDDKGGRIGAAESWAALDAGDIKLMKQPAPLEELDAIDRMVREDYALGKTPVDTVATLLDWEKNGPPTVDLATLEDTTGRNPTGMQDDPPPPEEEDKPDDGADESGGTGTAMALEEGKMGKKDSDRAEGQYRMQKVQEDPQLARQQAIEQARAAGILGNSSSPSRNGGFDKGWGTIGKRDDNQPGRLSEVNGLVAADGKLDPFRTMILIAPTAKATRLIKAIWMTDGAIAVSHAGKVRPLRLNFMIRGGNDPKYWLEARVSAKGIEVEAVPDKAITVTDLEQLAAALDTARKSRGADADSPVDVLVDPDIDVQRMIDVVVALDSAGVKGIGLGPAPKADELAKRGKRIPSVAVGQPNSIGDLDKAIIRRTIKQQQPKILECYTKALVTNPELGGTVMTNFLIAGSGKVQTAAASGVDPEVANCIAEVIKKTEFPKPKGGGNVQVNYPFTLRP